MAKSAKTNTPPSENFEKVVHLSPKHLTKQEFGKRLYNLMIEADMNQSDLARKAGIGRDSVSTYIRGRSMPEPKSLKKLAKALGVESADLLPNTFEAALDNEVPAVELKMSHSDTDKAWLRINRAVSIETAVAIIDMIKKEDKKG